METNTFPICDLCILDIIKAFNDKLLDLYKILIRHEYYIDQNK